MKLPTWLYPKEVDEIKYHFHLFIIAVLFISLWLLLGQLIPQAFGFEMPKLTWDYYLSVIISPLIIVVYFILLVSDVIAHSVLKLK